MDERKTGAKHPTEKVLFDEHPYRTSQVYVVMFHLFNCSAGKPDTREGTTVESLNRLELAFMSAMIAAGAFATVCVAISVLCG